MRFMVIIMDRVDVMAVTLRSAYHKAIALYRMLCPAPNAYRAALHAALSYYDIEMCLSVS